MNSTKKTKIDLADYPFKEDIANRILMSQFTVFDVEVLEEILLGSLTIHLSNLASDLGRDLIKVMEVVDKLSNTGLCSRVGEVITVDKDVRKYFEFQILKFDDHFKPDMDFLQGLLRKVPIHILPTWYAIPRASMNIFESILDKYLRSPVTYQRYLLELGFEDPVLTGIMKAVFEAPNYQVRSRELRDQYNLTREEFQERVLLLEFSFICCISYRQIDDEWKEVVTPFYEWQEHMQFLRDHQPKTFTGEVNELHADELAFARDFQHSIQTGKLPEDTTYSEWISKKLSIAKESKDEWLELELKDLAVTLYRHPDNTIISTQLPTQYNSNKNFREVEKSLSHVQDTGWIDFDDFFQGVTAVLHTNEEIELRKVGRRWAYVRPTYSEEDRKFIKAAIMERLLEAGFVSIGKSNGKDLFRITDFGRSILQRP